MTHKEAAKLVKRDIRTIQRWEKAGVDIADCKSLLAYADIMDCKARGSSKRRVRARLDARVPALVDNVSEPAILTSEYRAILANSASDAFVDLPAPFTQAQASKAIWSLIDLKSSFHRRLEGLRSTDHALSTELADSELAEITSIIDSLNRLLIAYEP